MANIPKKVVDRFRKEVPKFKRILKKAMDRDVNESDTVTIVTDMLASVFGYDKYDEVTSEQAIRGTYCDLALQVDGKIKYLIEVKAVGLDLKENHLRQALNYGANQGVPWVVLTNGRLWEIHRIRFEKPISAELVCVCDFLETQPSRAEDQARLFLLCREGISKAAIEEYHDYVQVVNRMVVAAIIQSEPLVSAMRRELRRMAPGLKVTPDDVARLLPEVLKRDVLDGEEAKKARQKLQRAVKAALRKKATN
jgi:predicted type IV restriction endonuclease